MGFIVMSRSALLWLCMAAVALGQAPARKPAPKPAKPAAKASAPAIAMTHKSAFDKPTLEAYLRHAMGWFPPIQIEIGDAKPYSRLPGFFEVNVHASLGQASQDARFLITKDGLKVMREPDVWGIDQNPFKDDLSKLKTQLQPSMGTPGAPVIIVVFTDFECPFCKEEAKMLRENLLKQYPKEVRLYFKDFPLEQMHPWSKPAAMAGRCIFRQNAVAFWQYHDWIYDNQEKITPENFKEQVLKWAEANNLDTLQLNRCIDTRQTEAEVDKSIAEGRELEINSTPTMFVNGRRLVGQIGWPQLQKIIDYEIEYQKTAKNAGEDCGCSVELATPGSAPGAASGTPSLTPGS